MGEMNINEKDLSIPAGKNNLTGTLTVPGKATALVIFAHGSGSSRFSPRNRYVAGVLNGQHLATLLVDLLTPEEDEVVENRFNIRLLAERLVSVTHFIHGYESCRNLPIGYFGASTGAASALHAAAVLPGLISAVVSRGGRPDLAEEMLHLVKAPTLLIVGGLDTEVIVMNKTAMQGLSQCIKQIRIVEGATHLFEEPGKLEEVSQLACLWLLQYLSVPVADSSLNS